MTTTSKTYYTFETKFRGDKWQHEAGSFDRSDVEAARDAYIRCAAFDPWVADNTMVRIVPHVVAPQCLEVA